MQLITIIKARPQKIRKRTVHGGTVFNPKKGGSYRRQAKFRKSIVD